MKALDLRLFYRILGAACLAYFLLSSVCSRFGLSLSWLWIVLGGILLAAGALTGRVPRGIAIAFRAVMLTGLAALLALQGLVISGMTARTPPGLDYLIVLGARVDADGPSRSLRWRINAAAEYLRENPDTLVIASGGKGSDEHISEAECIRNELIAAGIAENRILMEDKSTSTAENMAFSKALLPSTDVSVGLVTNNFHVCRAVKLAEKAGYSNVCGLAAPYTGPTLPHYMVREAVCLIVDFLRGNL